MTTHFKAYLEEQAQSPLYNGQGDDAHDGQYYLTGGASCFFTLAARALVEDGVSSLVVMRFLMDAAHETLQKEDPSRPMNETYKRVREDLLRSHGALFGYHFQPSKKKSKTEAAFVPSKTQQLSTKKLSGLCEQLRGSEGVTRKELFRSLRHLLVHVMKAEKFDQDLIDGMRELLVSLTTDFKEPAQAKLKEAA